MIKAQKLLILFLFFITIPSSAEIIKIRTNNQLFRIEKDIIINGPDSYLKTAFKDEQKMVTRQKDGSLFVNVNGTAMRIALGFIKHGKLEVQALSSPIVKKELLYLLPQLQQDFDNQKKSKKIWHCGAYCYSGIDDAWKREGFLIATDIDIFSAWKKLNKACTAKTSKLGSYATLTKHEVALNNHVGMSAPSMKESCVKRRP